MKASSILYPIMFIIVIYFIYSNVRNSIKYKKENMEVLLQLNYDDKGVHFISSLLAATMMGVTGILLFGMFNSDTVSGENVAVMIILPIMMVILYLPLSRKTRVSTLGIHKRSYLIRWEDIKSVNYLKPDGKKAKTKIIYLSHGRDVNGEITFLKDDPQLEQFKEIVKTYKVNKKGKKSGK